MLAIYPHGDSAGSPELTGDFTEVHIDAFTREFIAFKLE
jgi:hypothetical protein